ncbi:putative reverse transcriptase domain-containing protein [Tanacetum coccineum]
MVTTPAVPATENSPESSGKVMSSYTYPSIPSDYDVEDAFSSLNAPNYISTPPGYSPVTPGNISPDSSDDLTKDLLSSLSISPFQDDPYMKVIQAYDAIPPPQVIIALPAIVRHQESSEQDPRTQGRIPYSRIQPLDIGTSTSAAPAMTQAAIKKLVADSIATALEAQAATMANTNNTNRNNGTSRTPVARKGTNDHKQKFNDRRNTTTNNDNNYSNNRNNKNYQDNHNNHNRNNDYHQQQNRRQETIRTYAATPTENKRYTKKYHGNLPLCTRCTLHHTGVCTVKCQTCNKVGHLTRNCISKGPATGSNLQSVSITCHACREKGHYKSRYSKTDNNTFHISKKCLCDKSLVIPMKEIWLDDKLNFVEEPVQIMDREVKQLR